MACWCLECKRKKYKEYFLKNKEKINKKNREYNRKHKAELAKKSHEWYMKNRGVILEKTSEYKKKKNNELRMTVMKRLGGVECVWCGEDNFWVLSIDHINNDGCKERREKKRTSVQMWHRMLELTDEKLNKKYQVLCRNCNWMKRMIDQWGGLYG